MTTNDEQLLAELRQLNEHLKAFRRIAEGPLPAQVIDILFDLRKMAARALGYTVGK